MIDWPHVNVVVTGGAGFLGRFLCQRLRDRGCRRVETPRRVQYDLTTEDGVRRMYADCRPDVVFHLAAEVGGIGAQPPAARPFLLCQHGHGPTSD